MREIKFRAWDGEEMQYNPAINEGGHLNDDIQRMIESLGYTLMQYTGLKDKNGRDIYEGDIVDFYCRRDYDPTAPFYINRRKRKVVKWISNTHKNTINIRQTADQNIAYHEVIGNIYENSDLLK